MSSDGEMREKVTNYSGDMKITYLTGLGDWQITTDRETVLLFMSAAEWIEKTLDRIDSVRMIHATQAQPKGFFTGDGSLEPIDVCVECGIPAPCSTMEVLNG